MWRVMAATRARRNDPRAEPLAVHRGANDFRKAPAERRRIELLIFGVRCGGRGPHLFRRTRPDTPERGDERLDAAVPGEVKSGPAVFDVAGFRAHMHRQPVVDERRQAQAKHVHDAQARCTRIAADPALKTDGSDLAVVENGAIPDDIIAIAVEALEALAMFSAADEMQLDVVALGVEPADCFDQRVA